MRSVIRLFGSSVSAVTAAACLFLFQPGFAPAADSVAVASVFAKEAGEEVTVEGKIQEFRRSARPNVPTSFNVRDESGGIRVAVWANVFDESPVRDQIGDGTVVKVTGALAEFRGKMELHVRSNTGIELISGGVTAPPSEPARPSANEPGQAGRDRDAPAVVNAGITPVAALTRERLSQIFTISGKLGSARRPSGERTPYILKVSDGTGDVDVVFWEDVAEKLPDSKKVENGDQLQATGRLGEHRGSLQLRLNTPEDIKTPKSDPEVFRQTAANDSATTPGSSPRAEAEPVDSGDVGSRPVGRRVKLEGLVTSIEPLRLGRRVGLQSETTSPVAILLLWDTAEGLQPQVRQLKTSSTLAVTGIVAEARGTTVVVVSEPEDVLAVTP